MIDLPDVKVFDSSPSVPDTSYYAHDQVHRFSPQRERGMATISGGEDISQ
jgi:hypothetical protein